MTVVDDDTSRLWQLLTELSAQLSANKEHCENLKRQCEQLKTQAIHTGTGFTLRRFNTDITKEQFESELERFNATLVLENQALQYENRQLSMLLKDYEGTLDNVMAKFRNFAYSSQKFELESAKHYETLLMQNGGGEPTASSSSSSNALVTSNMNGHQQVSGARPAVLEVSDPLALQWSLAHLSSLIRKALRSIQGEDDVSSSESSSSGDIENCSNASDYGGDGATSQVSSSKEPLHTQIQALAAALLPSSQNGRRQSTTSQPTQHQSHSHHHDETKHDEGEGGYVSLVHNRGTETSATALDRDIELERLRTENEGLRAMLAIANEVPMPPIEKSAPSVESPSS